MVYTFGAQLFAFFVWSVILALLAKLWQKDAENYIVLSARLLTTL
ncbi:MAG: hypothetical protein ABIJ94_00335 [candidate division WOR-3 bacterium]